MSRSNFLVSSKLDRDILYMSMLDEFDVDLSVTFVTFASSSIIP